MEGSLSKDGQTCNVSRVQNGTTKSQFTSRIDTISDQIILYSEVCGSRRRPRKQRHRQVVPESNKAQDGEDRIYVICYQETLKCEIRS